MTVLELCRLDALMQVAPDYFLATLASDQIAPVARPGQFIHVLTDPAGELLRRPFSIQDTRQRPDGSWELELLFQVIGEGTQAFAARHTGDLLDCIGPQGHPWQLPESGPVALIGGGVGVPPLVFLAKALMASGIPFDFFQGARRSELLLMTDRIAHYGATLHLATDDGSQGHRGVVTALLPPVNDCGFTAVYACGPLPMLQAIARWAGVLSQGGTPPVPVWLSFENKMGCALGACLGCVIPLRSGRYDRVCTEGPIFAAESVDFARLTAL